MERELERLPEVVSGRLLVDGDGTFVGAYVIVRRDAMLKRVARDVRSTVAVTTGVDLALDQILVVEQHLADASISRGAKAPDAGPPLAMTSPLPPSTSPSTSSSATAGGRSPAGALDRAAARLLHRSMHSPRGHASASEAPPVPPWGELVVRTT